LGHAYRPIEDAVQLRLVVQLGKLRLGWFKLDSDIFAIFTILSCNFQQGKIRVHIKERVRKHNENVYFCDARVSAN